MIFNKSDVPDDLQRYFVRAEIGLEATPDAFVAELVDVFREVRRVLRDDGTVWLNLGDSYAGGGGGPKPSNIGGQTEKVAFSPSVRATGNLKPKDLIGIPWRAAFALQADGWFLRQDIIWAKPNPMPESVTDRCTKSHEYLFLLAKSAKYYYDAEAVAEPVTGSTTARLLQNVEAQQGSDRIPGKGNGPMKAVAPRFGGKKYGDDDRPESRTKSGNEYAAEPLRNRRSVWTVATQPFREAHFATYPPELIEPCILAGCPKGGTVLDPFGGAGTTGLVADRLQRNAVLIELNPEYAEIARKRINDCAGMFSTVEAA